MNAGPYDTDSTRQALPTRNVLLLALGLFMVFQYWHGHWPFHASFSPNGNINNDSVEPIDDNEQNSSRLAGSYLVVVEESKNRSVNRLEILNNYRFWSTLGDRGLAGFRILDPDSDASISFITAAQKQSIAHPFVMLVAADGKVLGVIKFPTRIKDIEAMLQ